jgi:hypothetical protein
MPAAQTVHTDGTLTRFAAVTQTARLCVPAFRNWVVIQGMQVTVTTTGGPIVLQVSAELYNQAPESIQLPVAELALLVDGSSFLLHPNEAEQVMREPESVTQSALASFTWVSDTLPAGQHTIVLRARNNGGAEMCLEDRTLLALFR